MALHLIRFVFLAIAISLVCSQVAAQSKLIIWPKEPGRRIRPAGTPGGQANALPQFDSFEIEDILVEGRSITIGRAFEASDNWLNDITIRIKNVSQQKFGSFR